VVLEQPQPTRPARDTSANGTWMRRWIWTARGAWIVLPITTGSALGETIQSWSHAPQVVAAVLLWLAWFAGLVALLTTRPWGFTTLRVVAPAAVALAIVSAWSAPAATSALAIVTTVIACSSALSSAVAHACAASTAYGPERRFPLRVPTPLLAGPLPLSVTLVAAAIACGPLLLANGDIVAGIVAVVAGAPLVFLLGRALVGLDHRWIVLVPAGLVVADPLTFPDPVLLPREQIALLRRAPETSAAVTGAHPLLITCREPGSFVRRAGRGQETVEADRLRVIPLRPGAVLAAAGAHRISVG
jgi:hypothetical protein